MGNMFDGPPGGYDVDTVNVEDRERFKCRLCLCIVKIATHGCNDHIFCKSCLKNFFKNKGGPLIPCPADCGQSFNKEQLKYNGSMDSVINEIYCKCRECYWKGDLIDLVKNHDGSCPEKLISCKLCKKSIKRRLMEKHLNVECLKRPISCQYCMEKFPFQDLENHEVQCAILMAQIEERELLFEETEGQFQSLAYTDGKNSGTTTEECVYSSGTVSGSSENFQGCLQQDTNIDEENKFVDCSYSTYGCMFQCSNEDFSQHNTDFHVQHLELLADHFSKENKQLKQDVSELHEKINLISTTFEDKLKTIEKNFKHLQRENIELKNRLKST